MLLQQKLHCHPGERESFE